MFLNKRGMNIPPVAALAAVLLASILFITAYSSRVSAAANIQAREATIQGEIVAVNSVNHTKTITVLSSEIGNFPNDKLNIILNKNTMVKMCTFKELAKGLNVGRTATIDYHESGGMAVADAVSEQC